MTSPEYQQLVEFLGRQFGDADRRFSAIDRQVTEVRQGLLGHFEAICGRSIGSSKGAHDRDAGGDCAQAVVPRCGLGGPGEPRR